MALPNPVKYLIKVWLTIILLTPIVVTVADLLHQYIKYDIIAIKLTGQFEVVGYLLLFGLLMSLPILFLILLLISKMDDIKNIIWKKAIIALFTLTLICLTFWLGLKDDIINHPENNIQLLIMFAPYIITTLTSIFVYKINPGR